MANPFSKKMSEGEKSAKNGWRTHKKGRHGGRPARQATGGERQAQAEGRLSRGRACGRTKPKSFSANGLTPDRGGRKVARVRAARWRHGTVENEDF